eukprot:jgi/Botrbrau1/14113/Bobra.182_3s0056.1
MESHKLRERATTVNYSVTGLHVTHTPGWLKGDNNKTRRTTFKDKVDKENEPNFKPKRQIKRQSAPARQAEKESPKQPATNGPIHDASTKPRRSARTSSTSEPEKNDSAPAEGSSKSSSPSGVGRKRRASRTLGDKNVKRSRDSQGKTNKKISPGQERGTGPGHPISTEVERQGDEAKVGHEADKPEAERAADHPQQKQQRVTRGSRRLSRPADATQDLNATTVEASAAVPVPIDYGEAELEPTTGTDDNSTPEPPHKSHPTEGMRPDADAENLACNPPAEVPKDDSRAPPGEQPSANFLALQTEYFSLLKKYQDLKEAKVGELEAVFREQAKKVADHGKAAMKLAEHWELEAKRQAAFAAAAGSAELEAELQELRARVITLSKEMIALESTVLDREEQIVDLTRQLHEALRRAEPPLTVDQDVQCSPRILTLVSAAQQCPTPSLHNQHKDPGPPGRLHIAVACCPEGAYLSELGSVAGEPAGNRTGELGSVVGPVTVPDSACQTPLATTVQGPIEEPQSGKVFCRSSAKPLVPYPVGCSVFPGQLLARPNIRSALQVPLPSPVPCGTMAASPLNPPAEEGSCPEAQQSRPTNGGNGRGLEHTPCSAVPALHALATLASTGKLDTLQRTGPCTLASSTDTPAVGSGAGPHVPMDFSALSLLTGFDVVAVLGRTFTLRHAPTGFTFNIGPSGYPFTPIDGVAETSEELIFQPLELGKSKREAGKINVSCNLSRRDRGPALRRAPRQLHLTGMAQSAPLHVSATPLTFIGTFKITNLTITKAPDAYLQGNAVKILATFYLEATDDTTVQRLSDDLTFNPNGNVRFCSRVNMCRDPLRFPCFLNLVAARCRLPLAFCSHVISLYAAARVHRMFAGMSNYRPGIATNRTRHMRACMSEACRYSWSVIRHAGKYPVNPSSSP